MLDISAIMMTAYQVFSVTLHTPVIIFFYVIFAGIGAMVVSRCFAPIISSYEAWLVEVMALGARLLHARENAEAVALLHGSEAERKNAFERLDRSIQPASTYVWHRGLSEFATTFYLHRGLELFCFVTIARHVFTGVITANNYYVLVHVLSKTTNLLSEFIALMLGNVEGQLGMRRLRELSVVMADVEQHAEPEEGASPARLRGEISLEAIDGAAGSTGCVLELRGVTLRPPKVHSGLPNRALFENLTLRLLPRESMLIVGESGIGKTSLIRCIAGLWCNGQGAIRRVPMSESFFVPQRPYMCTGTLREQLLYPHDARPGVDDEQLRAAVKAVELEHLMCRPGLDSLAQEDKGWWMRLSLGEMQRLSFARLFLHGSLRVVLLDEATSALSPAIEEMLYGLLKTSCNSYVSVAHRPELRRFHGNALVMEASSKDEEALPASWRLVSMPQYEQELALAAAGEGTEWSRD